MTDDGWTTVSRKKVKKPPSSKVVYCKVCNGPFLFSVEKQKLHKERDWVAPSICIQCKKTRKKKTIEPEPKPDVEKS